MCMGTSSGVPKLWVLAARQSWPELQARQASSSWPQHGCDMISHQLNLTAQIGETNRGKHLQPLSLQFPARRLYEVWHTTFSPCMQSAISRSRQVSPEEARRMWTGPCVISQLYCSNQTPLNVLCSVPSATSKSSNCWASSFAANMLATGKMSASVGSRCTVQPFVPASTARKLVVVNARTGAFAWTEAAGPCRADQQWDAARSYNAYTISQCIGFP